MAPTHSRRGLQDIRTMAGRVSSPGGKQRLFMRLATLELERVRREQEYQVASQRARLALERVQKLQGEIDQLIAASGRARIASTDADANPRPVVRTVSPARADRVDGPPLRYGARTTRFTANTTKERGEA